MKGIAAIFYRDYRQRMTNVGFVFWDLLAPLAYLTLFGLGFERMIGSSFAIDGQALSYTAFLLPGVRTDRRRDRRQAGWGYVDGYLVPVPHSNKDAYRAMAQKAADVFKEYGATRVVEAWGDDVPDGKVTDYKGAVQATGDENVVYSWVEWPSKEARDTAWPKIMEDERMKPDKNNMPFDGQRMIYGGFAPILDQ